MAAGKSHRRYCLIVTGIGVEETTWALKWKMVGNGGWAQPIQARAFLLNNSKFHYPLVGKSSSLVA